MKPLFKFLLLSLRKKQLILIAFSILIFIKILLCFLSFNLLSKITNKIKSQKSFLDKYSEKEIIWSMNAISNHIGFVKNCLVKSLAAKILLALSGLESSLNVGVKKESNILDVHAWLERNGNIIIGETQPIKNYVQLLKS